MNLLLSFNDDRTLMKCILKGDALYWVDEFESENTYQLYKELVELIKWEKPEYLIETSPVAYNYDLFSFLNNNDITTNSVLPGKYRLTIN